jgi:Xaa-Pro aminopeptidase
VKHFESEFFINNRKNLRQAIKNEHPIALTANGVVQRAGDSGFSFRQDSNFWYLTGINQPSCILVIYDNQEFIILPERNKLLDYFEGPINKTLISETSGIKTIYNEHEGWEALITLIKTHRTVNTCVYQGYSAKNALFINPSKTRLISQIKKIEKSVKISDVRSQLSHLRMLKQPQELSAINRAIQITADSFNKVMTNNWYNKLKTEQAVHAKLDYNFKLNNCQEAYPSIVAGGKRACILHYSDNNQPINQDELLLIDAGAEFNNYASDITRVFAPKKFSQKQKNVYKTVKDAQKLAYSLIKPGADIKKIDKKVESFIGKFLKSQKLITKQDSAQIRKYYPHAVSHHLGLDVHDVADYTLPLVENMVITVEPGIYVPEWGIGVRIEDDVAITKNGNKILSSMLPS